MSCIVCNSDMAESLWGAWCVTCGGVRTPSGGYLVQLVQETNGRKVLFDHSIQEYSITIPKILRIRGAARRGYHGEIEGKDQVKRQRRLFTYTGTLEEVLTHVDDDEKEEVEGSPNRINIDEHF